MFEQERKSGQLSLIQDQLVAWIDFVEGKIVRARSTELFDSGSHAVMMSLLDWQAGYFELSAGTPAVPAPDLETTVSPPAHGARATARRGVVSRSGAGTAGVPAD